MASLPGKKLRTLRRFARKNVEPPPTDRFDRYEEEYREILVAIRDEGGDEAVSELVSWMEERIAETGSLPEPGRVRPRARTILADRGVSVPSNSALDE